MRRSLHTPYRFSRLAAPRSSASYICSDKRDPRASDSRERLSSRTRLVSPRHSRRLPSPSSSSLAPASTHSAEQAKGTSTLARHAWVRPRRRQRAWGRRQVAAGESALISPPALHSPLTSGGFAGASPPGARLTRHPTSTRNSIAFSRTPSSALPPRPALASRSSSPTRTTTTTSPSSPSRPPTPTPAPRPRSPPAPRRPRSSSSRPARTTTTR